jgi:chorismate mutase/prephenate dehydratase
MTEQHNADPYRAQRAEIDRIDAELLALLNRRARAVLEIGRIKRRLRRPILVPEREREVLERLAGANSGPLSTEGVQTVFRTIIEQMRLLEESG